MYSSEGDKFSRTEYTPLIYLKDMHKLSTKLVKHKKYTRDKMANISKHNLGSGPRENF